MGMISKMAYAGALHVVLTIVHVCLYQNPWVWAAESLQYYSEEYCGDKFVAWRSLFFSSQQLFKEKPPSNMYEILLRKDEYERECEDMYKDKFNELFEKYCLNYSASSQVSWSIFSCILMIGIIAGVHWSLTITGSTLRKPRFFAALISSLVLIGINIYQMIIVLVSYFNANTKRRVLSTNPDRPNFENTCNSDLNYYGLFYNCVSLSIGLAISFTVINIYETRAHPLDHRYELGFEETAEDRARSELKHKNKQIDKERKLEYKTKLSSLNEKKKTDIPLAGASAPTCTGWGSSVNLNK